MLRACIQRFDVTGNLEKFCKILGTKQAPSNARQQRRESGTGRTHSADLQNLRTPSFQKYDDSETFKIYFKL